MCSEKDVVMRGGSWPALCDVSLHHGSRHTAGLQHLTRILAHHGNELKPCPMCNACLMRRSLIDYILDASGRELELPLLLVLNRQAINTDHGMGFISLGKYMFTSSLPLFYNNNYLSLFVHLHI